MESVKETETEGNAKKRHATVGVRERDWVREIERETGGRFQLSFCFTRFRYLFLSFIVATAVKAFAGGYPDCLLDTARAAPTISP